MTATIEYRPLYAALLAKRDATECSIRRESASLVIERSADVMDEITGQADRELVASEMRRLRSQQAAINCAIARYELGMYGICIECSEPIAPARLAALPEVANCVWCQAKRERRAR